jgi:hypothetical protein
MSKILSLIILMSLSVTIVAQPRVVKGEYIIKLRKGVNARQAFATSSSDSLFAKKALIKGSGGRFVRVKMRPEAAINGLRAFGSNPAIEYIEPNTVIELPRFVRGGSTRNAIIPNDEMYSKLWGLHNEKLGFDVDDPEAWKITKGSKKVVV